MVPYRGGRQIDCPRAVPWSAIAPHEQRAQLNHGQSLERLAERGGLSPKEFVAVISDRPIRDVLAMSDELATEFVKKCVASPDWAGGGK